MNSTSSSACRQSPDSIRNAELPPDLPATGERPRRWWPVVPPELLADERLTELARLVVVELLARGRWLRDGDGDLLAVMPCTGKLARDLHKDPATVRRIVRRLKATRRGDGWAYLTELLHDDGRRVWIVALPYPANPRRRAEYVPARERQGASEQAHSPEGSAPARARGQEAEQDRARPPRPSPMRGAVEPGQPPATAQASTPSVCGRDPSSPVPGLPCASHCRRLAECQAGRDHVAQLREREALQLQQEQAARVACLVPRGPSRVDTLALVTRCLPVLTLAAPGPDAAEQHDPSGLQVPEKSGSDELELDGSHAAEQQETLGDPGELSAVGQHPDPLLAQLERCRAVLRDAEAQHGRAPDSQPGQAGPLPVPRPLPGGPGRKGPRGPR